MKKVFLLNMPFASTRYPSAALSVLKPALESTGMPCDVGYLNVAFQAHMGRPDIYEAVADLLVTGEWVFGEMLYGKEWACSERANLHRIQAPLLPEGRQGEVLLNRIEALGPLARSFIDQCLEGLPWADYGIIGFTSVFSQSIASLALARRIKERWPDKIIAFGGANCQGEMGKALLRLFPFVDWVFTGEGDLAFPQAVAKWQKGESPEGIPGVRHRREGRIVDQGMGESPDMDGLPYPDFSDYFAALNRWAPDQVLQAPISLEFSRGCWWGKKSQCIFCGLNCQSLRYRSKSARRAEDEIKSLVERYRTGKVILTDSVVTMSYFKTLFPALAEWGRLEELYLEAKANLTKSQIKLLKSAGVTLLQPGIESLDTEILSHMRKGTTLLQNVRFLKWCGEYSLYPTWNLLYGFPGENPEAYDRMTRLVPSILHLFPPMGVSPMLLVRFSPLFEQGTEWGLEDIRAHPAYRSVYPFGQADLDQLAYFFESDFRGKEDIPTYIEPLREQVDAWKRSWSAQDPPKLTFEVRSQDRIVLRDTRPFTRNADRELEGEPALACLATDGIRPFDSLAGEIKAKTGKTYSGDQRFRLCLDHLVEDEILLREGDRYLCLALNPARDYEVTEDW